MIDGMVSIIVAVVSGVIVFIVGQILTHIWLDPLQQYKNLKNKIAFALVYYANVYSNTVGLDPKLYDEASTETRKIAAELSGFAQTLYLIHFGIPPKKTLLHVSSCLIGLSNSFIYDISSKSNNTHLSKEYTDKIKETLHLQDN